jgi:hypothetical protein
MVITVSNHLKLKTMINLEMPEDVQSYVREKQGQYKARSNSSSYSIQKTIFRIIKEHKELTVSSSEIKETPSLREDIEH